LSIGNRAITFCSENSTLLTGGFYLRDNSPLQPGGLPDGVVNLLAADGPYYKFDDDDPSDNYKVIEDDLPSTEGFYWHWYFDGVPLPRPEVEPIEVDPPPATNNVARISVDEAATQPPVEGHYAAIYHDHTFTDFTSHDHELYYLVFDVKTASGWRAADEPYDYEDGGEFNPYKFGPHCVSARVEWYANSGGVGSSITDMFYAYETTDAISGERLTRFCGRTYRPFNPSNGNQARVARIVLMVEGYMPDDERVEGPDNIVYFDNIAFFEAPELQQVYGALPGTAEKLYNDEDFLPPENFLDLKMTLNIQPIQPPGCSPDSYLLFTGTLFNDDDNSGTNRGARCIDLGFAFPILDDESEGTSSTQPLEWHYDVNHSAFVDIQDGTSVNKKIYPYAMSSHVDARPEYDMSELANPIGVNYKRSLGLQVSSYPIGALAIHDPSNESNLRGLSFGDSLGIDPLTPNVSHFGSRIDRLSWGGTEDFAGYAYIEFNLGLLAENAAGGNGTDFSFILFRSDDNEYLEKSVFREGIEKYQRSFYPQYFNRPTNTRDGEDGWLFGGAAYKPHLNDTAQAGFDEQPNQFGMRYEQIKYSSEMTEDLGDLLEYLYSKNVSALSYDLPWVANFTCDYADDMNLVSEIAGEADEVQDPLFPEQQAIYEAKRPQIFTLPPLDQELFYKYIEDSNRYLFPVSVAMTPDTDPLEITPLLQAEQNYFKAWYEAYVADQHTIGGVQLDNGFQDCHVDLNSVRVDTFASNGGRLTYSFNEFAPAVPQVTTNTWFFPHLRNLLDAVDNGEDYYTDYGDGTDANDPPPFHNIEEEIIGINANEHQLGGSKYAIMNADVIGFESSAQHSNNNSPERFNFRRILARDKAVSRQLGPVDCAKTAADNIPYGLGLAYLYEDDIDLYTQILNEVTWSSLAYGFMPGIHNMFGIGADECFPDEQKFDRFFDNVARDLFWTGPGYLPPRRGYTNVFQMLHLAGWQPVTNIINIAGQGSGGDPQVLLINRFGPYEGMGPSNRPFYITLYNNAEGTLTFTDVAEYNCGECIPIGSLESDEEVERLDICENNYGEGAFDGKIKNDLDANYFSLSDRNFWLEIGNADKLGINGVGNLSGHQMIGHVASSDPPVNDPTIHAEKFGSTGQHYSIISLNGEPPVIRLGGGRMPGQFQGPGTIEDKALMVFKIWLEPKVDNSSSGGERSSEADNPWFRTFGSGWTLVDDENAENGSIEATSTTVPGACALYSIDTGVNGKHCLRVKYPVYQEVAGTARYDVYVVDHLEEGLGSVTPDSLPEPALSVLVNQASGRFSDVDDEGFAAIGEFDVAGLPRYGLVSVVIRVSAASDEETVGGSGILVADAVKLEAVE
jgi:hypothetical protein